MKLPKPGTKRTLSPGAAEGGWTGDGDELERLGGAGETPSLDLESEPADKGLSVELLLPPRGGRGAAGRIFATFGRRVARRREAASARFQV